MYKIVTNNSLVFDKYLDVERVEGDFRDVLIKVRDLIHIGYSLCVHPLPASIRMLYSPYRSIVVSDGDKNINTTDSNLIIEQSIEKYDLTMGIRTPDYKNGDDYKLLDLSLTQSSINELQNFQAKRRQK